MPTDPNHLFQSRHHRGRVVAAVAGAAAALALAATPAARAATTGPTGDRSAVSGRSATDGPSGNSPSDRLKRFQAAHGLRATGRDDAATNQRLKTASPGELRQMYPAAQSSATLTDEECTNARTVIGVGKGHGIPQRGMEIALMAAMQESKFHNYTEAVDHDSLGIFQQRPSTGWGTPAQITNVVTSTQSFYGVADYGSNPGLLQISNWETRDRGDAAQAVQVSGYPDAYDQWQDWALDFYAAQAPSVSAISGDSGSATPCSSSGTPGKYYVDTFADASVYASPTSTTATGTLNHGTNYVYCKAYGRNVGNSTSYNHYWLKTDPDSGPADQWVSAYYLSRWGNDEAKDNNGTVIPDC